MTKKCLTKIKYIFQFGVPIFGVSTDPLLNSPSLHGFPESSYTYFTFESKILFRSKKNTFSPEKNSLLSLEMKLNRCPNVYTSANGVDNFEATKINLNLAELFWLPAKLLGAANNTT